MRKVAATLPSRQRQRERAAAAESLAGGADQRPPALNAEIHVVSCCAESRMLLRGFAGLESPSQDYRQSPSMMFFVTPMSRTGYLYDRGATGLM